MRSALRLARLDQRTRSRSAFDPCAFEPVSKFAFQTLVRERGIFCLQGDSEFSKFFGVTICGQGGDLEIDPD